MEVTQNVAILRASLEEVTSNFFNGTDDQHHPENWDPRGTLDYASKAFMGEPAIPGFSIPRGVGCEEVVLYNRELLCRWTAMQSFHQQALVRAVHRAFKETHVNEIEMTIPWSKASTRQLRIRYSNGLEYPVFHLHLV